MMDEIRAYVNSLNFEDYESKEDVIDSVACEFISDAADYERVANMVSKALEEREAMETA